MRSSSRDVLILLSIHILFMSLYHIIYPLHAPANGYFMIESIPIYFWALYASALAFHLFLLIKHYVTAKSLQILLTYMLLYLCSMRTFASLHFTGFMGSDSPNFVGLTRYWVSHDNINLTRISYGDNPGLFILSKVFISITAIDVNLYTIFIGIIWIMMVYIVFKLFALNYISAVNHEHRLSPDIIIIPLIAALSYLSLAVPFTVNFQYAPQTFSLVLLLAFFYLLARFLNKGALQDFITITVIYAVVQISHPFMFLFGIAAVALLILTKYVLKMKSLLLTTYMKSLNLEMLLSSMTMFSLTYIMYQTMLLQRRLGEVIRNILEAFRFKIPTEYFEQLATPSLPYEASYYVIALVHSIAWIIIALIIALPVLKTLASKESKYYELSIIAGSLIASILFASSLTLQEFTIRAGQILLFGILLLAIRGLVKVDHWHKARILNYITQILSLILVISSFLSIIRYTWYAQPPHLSPRDITISDVLERIMDFTRYYEKSNRLLLWNALNAYHNSRLYGTHPVTYSPIMLSSYASVQEISNYDMLWSNMLSFEILKYFGESFDVEGLYHTRSIVLNTQYMVYIYND